MLESRERRVNQAALRSAKPPPTMMAGSMDGRVAILFFVDLALVSEPELLTQTVAAACDLSLVEELLVATLATREVLNLLDNFEHLIDEAARIVDLLLARCGRLSVLATSREARL